MHCDRKDDICSLAQCALQRGIKRHKLAARGVLLLMRAGTPDAFAGSACTYNKGLGRDDYADVAFLHEYGPYIGLT